MQVLKKEGTPPQIRKSVKKALVREARKLSMGKASRRKDDEGRNGKRWRDVLIRSRLRLHKRFVTLACESLKRLILL